MTGATPLGYLADGDLTYCPSLKDMFLGNIGGAMGETCVIAILIGCLMGLLVSWAVSRLWPLREVRAPAAQNATSAPAPAGDDRPP